MLWKARIQALPTSHWEFSASKKKSAIYHYREGILSLQRARKVSNGILWQMSWVVSWHVNKSLREFSVTLILLGHAHSVRKVIHYMYIICGFTHIYLGSEGNSSLKSMLQIHTQTEAGQLLAFKPMLMHMYTYCWFLCHPLHVNPLPAAVARGDGDKSDVSPLHPQ